ncbi:hypothetical protein D9M71_355990 [compost metagenome]
MKSTPMPLFNDAVQLLRGPVTVAAVKQFEQLEDQAQGAEAERIGDLWEAVYAAADDDALNYLQGSQH